MFADLVRDHRRRLGLTQEALAERAGLSARAIGKIESGRSAAPRLPTKVLLADVFGLSGGDREAFLGGGARRPAQLPADVSAFTGREPELARLTAAARDRQPGALVISALSGTAGVGKTALAVHWAHRVRADYPDGQLHMNLRGYDPEEPMSPHDALGGFLRALGVPADEIPADGAERAARYRSELADRRMLILLDNASAAEQVRPLLPGAASCLTLVTSRDTLSGLVARDGARRVDLDLLAPDESVALLRALIGARVDADPAAAAELAARCAHLPLALRVAGELAVIRPAEPLADLVAELARTPLSTLDAVADPRTEVTAVFSWSLRNLPPPAADAFRLLGLHPGPEIDAYALAALADTTLADADRILRRLAAAHLITPTGPDTYAPHDLLRAYARRLAAALPDPRAATDRLIDFHLTATADAVYLLYPAEADRRPELPPVRTPLPVHPDPPAARGWLDAQLPAITALGAQAAALGRPEAVIRLSAMLFRHLDGAHYTEAMTLHGYARDAADAAGDPAALAQSLMAFAGIQIQTGRYADGIAAMDRARTLFAQVGNDLGVARTTKNIGVAQQRLGNLADAADCHARALEMFRTLGDRQGEAQTLNALGLVETRRGRHDAAAGHHTVALALVRGIGDQVTEAYTLNNLGDAELHRGRLAEAEAHQRAARALFRAFGNGSGEAWSTHSLGTLRALRGDHADALDRHLAALAIFARLGDDDGRPAALNGAGHAATALGRPADAVTHHTAAAAIASGNGARDAEAEAHEGLAAAFRALGRAEEVSAHASRARTLRDALDPG